MGIQHLLPLVQELFWDSLQKSCAITPNIYSFILQHHPLFRANLGGNVVIKALHRQKAPSSLSACQLMKILVKHYGDALLPAPRHHQPCPSWILKQHHKAFSIHRLELCMYIRVSGPRCQYLTLAPFYFGSVQADATWKGMGHSGDVRSTFLPSWSGFFGLRQPCRWIQQRCL